MKPTGEIFFLSFTFQGKVNKSRAMIATTVYLGLGSSSNSRLVEVSAVRRVWQSSCRGSVVPAGSHVGHESSASMSKPGEGRRTAESGGKKGGIV